MFSAHTHYSHHGLVHTLKLAACQVKIVPPSLFDAVAVPGAEKDAYYRVAHAADLPDCLLVSSIEPVALPDINRDTAWRRRLDIWRLLQPRLPVGSAGLANSLPLAVLNASVIQWLPPGSGLDDILRACTRNTQALIDQAVDRHLAASHRAAWPSPATDPLALGYSHIDLFAALYAAQIGWMIDYVRSDTASRTFTVVDLGCGSGHFLLALARRLSRHRLLRRMRLIGLDSTDRDMRFAVELISHQTWQAQFQLLSLEEPHALDRLRRLEPDFIVCNHVLEHLPGPLENRWLHDLALASRCGISVSLPVDGGAALDLCAHRQSFAPTQVEILADAFPVRCAGGVRHAPLRKDWARLGLLTFEREAPAARYAHAMTVVPVESTFPSLPAVLAEDFAQPFHIRRFRLQRRALAIGRLTDTTAFGAVDSELRQIRQLLIKAPRGKVQLPVELAQFEEAVSLIVAHNQAFNPRHEEHFAYLNVFRGTSFSDSYRGLSLNLHGDQLQCLDERFAYPPDWSYIVSSALPTTLFDQGFDIEPAARRWALGETVNLYDSFRDQARLEFSYRSVNFEILLLSPYIVHAATPAEEPTSRVFLKVAFSTRRMWDNRELRENAALPIANWKLHDTLGLNGGFLSHGHWNERFVQADILGGTKPVGLQAQPSTALAPFARSTLAARWPHLAAKVAAAGQDADGP